jgi:SAM-dependent methyltransferase
VSGLRQPRAIAFYNALAPEFDRLFEAPHRRAYDLLAWEIVQPLLPTGAGHIIDAGCGTGRWARALVNAGYEVTGIEPAPAMAEIARRFVARDRFRVLEDRMEQVQLPDGGADVVVALGSVQYTTDLSRMLERFASWVRVGGWVVVLVDSFLALVLELVASRKILEARQRVQTRRAIWTNDGRSAEYALLSARALRAGLKSAGLKRVCVCGLLVGFSILGRDRLTQRLTSDWEAQLAIERRLTRYSLLADLGKQLLAYGQRVR